MPPIAKTSFALAVTALLSIATGRPARAESTLEAKVAVDRLSRFAKGHESATPEKIVFVYFTPADRTPPPGYRERLGRVMRNIQEFYAREIERRGLGQRTIRFDREANGALALYDVKGRMPAASYIETVAPTGELIRRESRPVLAAAGIDDSKHTIIYFCDVRTEQNGRVSGIGPYYGTVYSGAFEFGHCWFTDATILDPNLLGDKTTMIQDEQYGRISVGRYNTIFLGGAAHELGHGLGLPHDKEHKDDGALGISIMGFGNRNYGEERRNEGRGTFLTLADALRLASHPMFSDTVRDLDVKPECQLEDLRVAVRGATLEVSGRIVGNPEPYAIIAYNDPDGGGDYDATTWTAPLDAQNRFVLHIGEFKPGGAELRITVCHVNGSNSTFRYPITAGLDGVPNPAAMIVPIALHDALKCWADGNMEDAQRLALQAAQAPAAEPEVREWAQSLAAITLPAEPEWPALASLRPETREASLGRVAWQSAEVGWMKPTRNYFPREVDPNHPFLCLGGQYFADGLYAHSPSLYMFDLGGQWKTFSAAAGLQAGATGSAVFVVKADGREIYRSPKIACASAPFISAATATVNISANITGAKTLELIVEDAGDGNRSAWSIWCAPKVLR